MKKNIILWSLTLIPSLTVASELYKSKSDINLNNLTTKVYSCVSSYGSHAGNESLDIICDGDSVLALYAPFEHPYHMHRASQFYANSLLIQKGYALVNCESIDKDVSFNRNCYFSAR